MQVSGYQHPAYIRSLTEFGEPLALRRSGGWLLRRAIRGTDHQDATGPYPYLVCEDWKALGADLKDLERDTHGLVSIAAAPDPFGDYSLTDLQEAFPDRAVLFKQHFSADLHVGIDKIASQHHRREADRASRKLTLEVCDSPIEYLESWNTLFDHAVRRFEIGGIRAFSRRAFEYQLAIPGTTMWIVRRGEEIVAASLTMIHGDVAHAHLLAATPEGRKLGASYVIYAGNIRHLAERARWIDWGGVAGPVDADTGLAAFKRGWSTGLRPAYFCGRIMDRARYAALANGAAAADSYFPAYRAADPDS